MLIPSLADCKAGLVASMTFCDFLTPYSSARGMTRLHNQCPCIKSKHTLLLLSTLFSTFFQFYSNCQHLRAHYNPSDAIRYTECYVNSVAYIHHDMIYSTEGTLQKSACINPILKHT